MNFELRLKAIESTIKELSNLKVKTETQLDEKKRIKAELIAEMSKLGTTPDNIEEEIETLKTNIEKEITELETKVNDIKAQVE
jgi:chromosome segregation ATPase